MEDAIKTLGYQEAMAITNNKQQAVVTCEYCNNEFAFDKVDLEAIFH